MFKKLVFLMVMAITVNATAQKSPCKYIKESKDAFTKKITKSAYMAVGAGIAGRELIMQESEGKFYMTARIIFNTDFADVPFKKTDKVNIMCENGKLIEIIPKEDVVPNIIRVLDLPLRQWIVTSEVPLSVYEQIAQSQITAISYSFNGHTYQLAELKDRQTKKIMETAACMLANK